MLWIENRLDTEEGAAARIGCLITYYPLGRPELETLERDYWPSLPAGSWVQMVVPFTQWGDDDIEGGMAQTWRPVLPHGTLADTQALQVRFDLEEESDWGAHLNRLLLWERITLATIHMMNQPGARIESHAPPPKLAKRRRERGRNPLVTFRTVTISPNAVTALVEATRSGPAEAPVAKHLVRAHEADYTKGKGLFGKYKVKVRRRNYERGSIEAGLVIKDYEVKP